jgi:hypothetical protein
MDDTLRDGDLVIARRQSTYDVGDIVAYRVPKGDLGEGTMVIHRIVGGSGSDGYLAQGDNNPGQDPWHPRDPDVVGKLFVHVPRVGLLLTFFQTTLGLALLAGLASAVWAAGSPPKPKTAKLGGEGQPRARAWGDLGERLTNLWSGNGAAVAATRPLAEVPRAADNGAAFADDRSYRMRRLAARSAVARKAQKTQRRSLERYARRLAENEERIVIEAIEQFNHDYDRLFRSDERPNGHGAAIAELKRERRQIVVEMIEADHRVRRAAAGAVQKRLNALDAERNRSLAVR